MREARVVSLLVVVALLAPVAAPRADQVDLLRAGDAFVAEDTEGGKWTIGAGALRFDLELDPLAGLRVAGLADTETGQDWDIAGGADSGLSINGAAVVPGSRTFPFVEANASLYRSGVRLDLVFRGTGSGARVTRSYVCYPGAPVVESWTIVQRDRLAVKLSNVSPLKLAVSPGLVRWVTGIDTSDEGGGPFTRAWTDLAEGETLTLGAKERSTQFELPWFMVDGERGEVFAGLAWSGAWRATITRTVHGIEARVSFPDLVTDVSATPFETPHAFVGVTGGSIDEASQALQSFIRLGLRDGRGFNPLVAYNTWFAYGTHIDEDRMRAEIAAAADVGAELFVLDAGWYGQNDDQSDFTPGLGRWIADEERFPSGLGALREYAHERGLKFGLWVEPERVALETVNRPGLTREAWLATVNGRYDPATVAPGAAQVCLASAAARAWVLDTLTALIDEVQPDYLKWDNNFWINCTRSGHGHGTADGNFAHVKGLYEVLAELRARYPDLLIENCAGGGHRLDFGLLQYTDAGWMDDRSAPSARVRHELEGLSIVLPPPYLFSFVMSNEEEPLIGGKDLPLYFRSRMPGMLGLTWRSDELSETDRDAIRREIDLYKSIRHLVRGSSARLLTEQVAMDGGGGWDVVQHITPEGDAVVYAFAAENAGRFVVRPVGLVPDTTYEVSSLDYGVLTEAAGAELMADGIELEPVAVSRAHVLVFRVLDLRDVGR